jgi:succinylglutamate desuccinylase
MQSMEKIIEISGAENGPQSIILAGTHGDEVCGIKALEKILPSLKIERGRVFFGYGNPRAIERNVRFTEANLNRMFKDDLLLSEKEKRSYEYGRSRFLMEYLDRSEALLDLHASFVPKSDPFIICNDNAWEIIKYFSPDIVVSGLDDIEPGGTDCYMNRNGKIGICVECGYLGDNDSAKQAEDAVFHFLVARGHIKADIKAGPRKSFIKVYILYITKTDSFVLSKKFDDFEEIAKGEMIGMDGKEEIRADRDSIILFARGRKAKGDEAFVLGECVKK